MLLSPHVSMPLQDMHEKDEHFKEDVCVKEEDGDCIVARDEIMHDDCFMSHVLELFEVESYVCLQEDVSLDAGVQHSDEDMFSVELNDNVASAENEDGVDVDESFEKGDYGAKNCEDEEEEDVFFGVHGFGIIDDAFF